MRKKHISILLIILLSALLAASCSDEIRKVNQETYRVANMDYDLYNGDDYLGRVHTEDVGLYDSLEGIIDDSEKVRASDYVSLTESKYIMVDYNTNSGITNSYFFEVGDEYFVDKYDGSIYKCSDSEEAQKIFSSMFEALENQQYSRLGRIVDFEGNLTFIIAEWISTANPRRMEALGIKESDMPGGFFEYMHEDEKLSMKLKSDAPFTYRNNSTSAVQGLLEHFRKYVEENPFKLDESVYWMAIKDNEVISVKEQYIP